MKRLMLCIVAVTSSFGSSGRAAEVISVPLGQRQLFLDDYCVAKSDGLRKTMHSPVKRGAVIQPDRPWELWLQTRCMPAWEFFCR